MGLEALLLDIELEFFGQGHTVAMKSSLQVLYHMEKTVLEGFMNCHICHNHIGKACPGLATAVA